MVSQGAGPSRSVLRCANKGVIHALPGYHYRGTGLPQGVSLLPGDRLVYRPTSPQPVVDSGNVRLVELSCKLFKQQDL
ncbi:MAG: hypothetical protein Ct9H300mP16_00990 [Pseudomonadota bacterium]|nr:MAG: hypothetical protein Ct9H300mP16_00990 [Pseudomonadota bacterium]